MNNRAELGASKAKSVLKWVDWAIRRTLINPYPRLRNATILFAVFFIFMNQIIIIATLYDNEFVDPETFGVLSSLFNVVGWLLLIVILLGVYNFTVKLLDRLGLYMAERKDGLAGGSTHE